MTKIITAINNPALNKELENENNIEIICKDIQYKEGILEILENKTKIDYIIFDYNLPGEIEINKLIENILEKNEKIKIIITINKENKNKININNIYLENKNIIKIFYEKNINLNKLKNYNNNLKKIDLKNNKIENKKINNKKLNKLNNKKNKLENQINNIKIKNINKISNIKKYKKEKIEEKNLNIESKIITVWGDYKVGKSITIINFIDYIIQKKNKNAKILIIELNEDSPSFYILFGCKKFNKININKDKKYIKIKKTNKYKFKQKFKRLYISKKVIENLIIEINKNIDLISYNKLINFNIIKKLEKKYNYLFIEIYSKKNKIINKKILNNSNKNILLIKPNLLEIKNSKKIIEKNKLNKNNNLKILINNYNKNSIDEKIIKNIFKENKIIGKINYEIGYERIINNNFKNTNFLSKEYNQNLKEIIEKII